MHREGGPRKGEHGYFKGPASCALWFCLPRPHPRSEKEMHGSKVNAHSPSSSHIPWSPQSLRGPVIHVPCAALRDAVLWTEDRSVHPAGGCHPKATRHPHLCNCTVTSFLPLTADGSQEGAHPSSLGGDFGNSHHLLFLLGP